MKKSIYRSKWFWIIIGICAVEVATVAVPLLIVALFAAAFYPGVGMRFALFFLDYYNDIHNTAFEILDISRAKENLNPKRFHPSSPND
jgi:hypothetical protein